jgi:predicted nucleotidyltransferase component of viral defense system
MAIWSWCLSDKPSLQDLLEVQKHFGLPSPALVEKDWYVVKALAALVAVDVAPFRLVFGGGTALNRAHRLIRRMSEDIDLRIISDTTVTRPALRHLRDIITKALLQAGSLFDPENPRHRESGNASRYTLYRLPYAPITAGEGTLRPEIQIETAVWPLRRPVVDRSVSRTADQPSDP